MRILDSRDSGIATQDRVASESVMATSKSGRGNLGMRGHDAAHLSFYI